MERTPKRYQYHWEESMAKTTPEGRVKAQIKTLLKKHNVYYHMPVQNGMGAPTLDFICCVGGYYLGIEAKAPGKIPTPRQYDTMREIEKACGMTAIVSSDPELRALETLIILTLNNNPI